MQHWPLTYHYKYVDSTHRQEVGRPSKSKWVIDRILKPPETIIDETTLDSWLTALVPHIRILVFDPQPICDVTDTDTASTNHITVNAASGNLERHSYTCARQKSSIVAIQNGAILHITVRSDSWHRLRVRNHLFFYCLTSLFSLFNSILLEQEKNTIVRKSLFTYVVYVHSFSFYLFSFNDNPFFMLASID